MILNKLSELWNSTVDAKVLVVGIIIVIIIEKTTSMKRFKKNTVNMVNHFLDFNKKLNKYTYLPYSLLIRNPLDQMKDAIEEVFNVTFIKYSQEELDDISGSEHSFYFIDRSQEPVLFIYTDDKIIEVNNIALFFEALFISLHYDNMGTHSSKDLENKTLKDAIFANEYDMIHELIYNGCSSIMEEKAKES